MTFAWSTDEGHAYVKDGVTLCCLYNDFQIISEKLKMIFPNQFLHNINVWCL